MTFTELSKSSVFVVKSLAPPPLPLLVGVLNTTSPSFGSGWHATLIRVKSNHVTLSSGAAEADMRLAEPYMALEIACEEDILSLVTQVLQLI